MLNDLLAAEIDRARGYKGRTADEVLADMDQILSEAAEITVQNEQSIPLKNERQKAKG